MHIISSAIIRVNRANANFFLLLISICKYYFFNCSVFHKQQEVAMQAIHRRSASRKGGIKGDFKIIRIT